MKPVNVNANADSQLPSEPSPHSSTPAPKSAAPSRDPFAPMESRTEKADSAATATKPKVMILEPANRSTEVKPATNQVTMVNQASPTSQKSTTPSNSISSPSPRPAAAAAATPRPVTQNSNKDSKLNSMVKKAGRFLKKPF